MKTSETQGALLSALFEARKLYPKIAKTKDGQAGHRTFKYAPMEDILDAVEPINNQHGLIVTQPVDGHNVITRLEHVPSGEWRETSMPVNVEHANMQSYGIELTYRRRYAIQGMLGIITEEDTDGVGGQKRKGADHQKNANGTEQAAGTISASKLAFDALQPEIQDAFRKAAPHVTAAMPDTDKAINLLEMALDNWPDEGRQELKAGFWHLLDSKTRSGIKRAVQVNSMKRGMQ